MSKGIALTLSEEALEEIVRHAAELAREELMDDGYMNVQGACDFLACKPDRIYALVSAARIPHHRDGSRLLFDRAELREYVRAGGAKRP